MSNGVRSRRRMGSVFQREAARFRRLLGDYAGLRLDQVLDLKQSTTKRRRTQVLTATLVVAVAAFGLHLLLRILLGGGEAAGAASGAFLPEGVMSGLRVVLVLGIAASVGLDAAGSFLGDIFEIRDLRVAWRYIGRLATGAGETTLRLREGRIAEADKDSPILQIGGPGRVFVDFDTAALFERPDGTPHVVGGTDPTRHLGEGALAGFALEGFERLREPVISLRDQYIGNPSGEPLTVAGRSLDGVPVSVTDVRGLFSVRRELAQDSSTVSGDTPFPFRAADVENLIYHQAVEVLTSGEHASSLPGDWTSTMHVLIRESLREFMAQNRLAEFLAGVGAHDSEKAEFAADTMLTKTLEVTDEVPGTPAALHSAAPTFRPRTELSNNFKKYESEFSLKAKEHGLELHWIGVGTWKMPDEASEAAMNEKHLEAWRLNHENAQRSAPEALDRVSEAASISHVLRLIEEVPLRSHEKNRTRYDDKGVLLECMLQDIWMQLGDALDIWYRRGTPAEEFRDLEEATLKVEQLLHISQMGHVIGGGGISRVRKASESAHDQTAPPAPASRAEAQRYQALLGRLNGDYRVAEAMISNERRRHGELSREQLIARIVERFERHGRK